jgi:isopentenyl-diphosphate delta-isomerase
VSKVTPISRRKADHIKINLDEDVRSGLTTGLERYRFVHQALPELDLERINTTTRLFGKSLSAPILISSMTGGTARAAALNLRLAEAAQVTSIAMGVGSQRAALESPDLARTFQVRKVAPDILLFANLGAVQLNYGLGVDDCRRAVDMIQADALVLHLNPLQEVLQAGGNTNFEGLARKIGEICKNLEVPLIVKEVGWGISERVAKVLADSGVTAVDVAGAGGTSWSQVESFRAESEFDRQVAATFINWGIPTADSILNVKRAAPDIRIFASGGLKDGLDLAKCIALGATLGGIAGKFLRTVASEDDKTRRPTRAVRSATENILELIKLTQRQIAVAMFVSGAGTMEELSNVQLHLIPEQLSG